ncbi:MAG: thioredoxin-disulfide reductase [Lachnospiraceae bacterium]|jgi:thioredoxin reductase (NADPH)|nr:thioredoxin-disulfide reductase [Lachnospiraceae bacterium]
MPNTYDLIIIGAGPAGLSAAVYARRAALDTLVLDLSHLSGGQVLKTYEVDNYLGLPGIGGFDLGERFRAHAERFGPAFATGFVTGIKKAGEKAAPYFLVNTDDGSEYQGRAVVIAAGASHARLGVAGEEELAGAGVSYCATCDGAFYKGGRVAVVGGGDVAVEDALFLARICQKVYLIHRRGELRAAAILAEAVQKQGNVEILWDTVVESIDGDGEVTGLSIKNVKSGETSALAVDGVFIAVGLLPNSEAFRSLVACDSKGYIVAGEDGVTSTPGVFAAGDIRTKKLRQIITACADGAAVVSSVQKYLSLILDSVDKSVL